MTSEEKAEGYVADWLHVHGEHEHSVKTGDYSVYAECFDCGDAYALTITLLNDDYAGARGVVGRERAVTFY